MKKFVAVGICIILLSLTPTVFAAGDTDVTILDHEVEFIMGLFPRQTEDMVSFFSLTPPGSRTIPVDDFDGYMGTIFIIGFYNPAPM